MSKKKIFQYAVLFHKQIKDKEDRTTVDTQLIIEPKCCLAASEKEVLFKVTREIPEEYVTNPDDVEILVRNF